MERILKAFLLSVVGALFIFTISQSQSASGIVVYDDDLAAPWFHTTYNSTVTMVSTEQAYAGTASMKITATSWGWISMHYGPWNTPGFSPEQYKSVDFAIYPTSAAASVAVFLENERGQTFPKIARGTFAANQWTIVSVSMKELNPNGYEINRLFIQEFTGSSKTFYIDAARFVSVVSAPATPTLLTPANGTTNVPVSTTLNWNPAANSESYQLQVSTSNSFSTTLINQSGIIATTFSVTGLSNSTTYYWRVNAKNPDGTSDWSSVWNFATVTQPLATPTLLSPSDGATNQTTALSLSWNTVPEAQSYRLQVSVSSSFSTTVVNDSTITSTSKQLSGLSSNTQYFWRVQARNSNETSTWSSIRSFTTAMQTLSVPSLVSPANGAANQPTIITLVWNSVPDAQYYRLQVSTSSSFPASGIYDSTFSTTARQINIFSPNVSYYWRVSALNAYDTSDWSNIWSFTTSTEPLEAPTLVSPTDGAANQPTNIIVQWNAVLNAQTYRLQVSTTSSFSSIVIDDSTLSITSKELSGLSSNGQYFWRVSARNTSSASDWSAIWSFTTLSSALSAPIPLYPANETRNQPVALTFRWSSITGSQFCHLQVSTSPAFSTIAFQDSTITDTTKYVSNVSYSTKYYWRVSARNTTSRSGWSEVWSFNTVDSTSLETLTLQTTIPFPNRKNPADFQPADYKLIGIPGASNARVSSYLPGTPGVDWQMYWDNGTTENYLIPFSNGPEFIFSVGKAFWMIKNGPWTLNTSVAAPSVNDSGDVEIPLHSGWNLITNPLLTTISWENVQLLNSPYASEPLFTFSEGSYILKDSLEAFTGYYFFNASNLATLRIPAVQTLTRLSSPMLSGWRVNVVLKSGTFIDRTLWFGISPDAKIDYDSFDFHKPKGISNSPTTSFYRQEWDDKYSSFASDIRPFSENIERWEFDVRSFMNKASEISFIGIENVPQALEIYLVDDERKTYINLRTTSTYRFLEAKEQSRFAVLVGSREEMESALPAYQAPTNMVLGANYPNPFNPSTKIPFELSEETSLHITIYNVLGQEVTTLFAGRLAAGKHSITWNGADESGARVPSGIYFYSLSTSHTQKLTRRMIFEK